MATPTNLKTGTVDIGVNAYSKPVNSAAVEAVGTGMDLWAKESKRRFDQGYEQDLQNLRTLQETDPIVKDSIAASELLNRQAVQGGLNEVDSRTLKSLEKDYETLDILLEQGKNSFDMYRLRGSNLLRNAIMLRPDLGDELRSVASKHLGVDVNNAYLEIWKEGQMRLEKQLDAGKKDAGGLSNATFKTYFERNAEDPDVMAQQANNKIVEKALKKWTEEGDSAGARALLRTVSWGGDENPAIAARETFLNSTTQQDYAATLTRLSTLAKQSVLDPVAFDAEIPQLQTKQKQLTEWRSSILSDNSSLIKDKEDIIARIDGFLNPINQLLSAKTDEEKLNIINNSVAVAQYKLKPTATALVSSIAPHAENVNADTVSLVSDGLAIGSRKNDPEFADYVPSSAYIMNRQQLNSAFKPVLVKTANNLEKANTTTEALAAMMSPYANPKVMGNAIVMHSPDQMYNLLQIFNSNNGELLARSQLLAKNNPILLEHLVGLRYGMITEMQKSRFSSLPQELKQFVDVTDLGQMYVSNPKGIPNEAIKWRVSDKATPEQEAKIRQWAQDNPPAKNAVGFQQFVDDTLTMAGRIQGAK